MKVFSKIKSIINQNRFLILFIIVTFLTLPKPGVLPSSGLDPSWILGINIAYIKHLQFGKDVLFTYGIFGFLQYPLMLEFPLWIASLAFSYFVHFLFVFSVYLILKNLPAKWYYYLLFIPILVAVLPLINTLWALLISVSLFLFSVLTKKFSSRTIHFSLIVIGFLLALDSLIKYDILINSLYLIFIFNILCYIKNRELQQGASLIISYIVSFIGLWVYSNQALSNIFSYINGGFELMKDYTEAMSFQGPLWQVYVGLGLFALFILIGTYYFINKNERISIFFILNLFIFFSAFKSGFVRHDLGHLFEFACIFLTFFGIVSIIILDGLRESRNPKHKANNILVIIIIIVISISSIYFTAPWILQNVVFFQTTSFESSFQSLNNRTFFDFFDQQVIKQKEKIKKEYPIKTEYLNSIGNKSIDVLPWDIAVLWAYDLNWFPRPIFQSYSAYTPYLDDLNAQHFQSDSPPEYLLYSFKSIDGRYPLFDEPKTFQTILQNYIYEEKSGEFILLKQDPTRNQQLGSPVDLGVKTAYFGQPVSIPKTETGYIFGYVDMKYSSVGEFIKIVFKPSPCFVQFKLKDGTYTPKYRFISDVAKNGIFLSQYIRNNDEVFSIFNNSYENNIESIIFYTDHPWQFSEFIIQFRYIPSLHRE